MGTVFGRWIPAQADVVGMSRRLQHMIVTKITRFFKELLYLIELQVAMFSHSIQTQMR
jgi:hypothetical protein